jgi:hypothetical protein
MSQEGSAQLRLDLAPREAKTLSWEGSDDDLLDVNEAAALLTVRPSTLRY